MLALFIRQQQEDEFFSQSLCVFSFGQFFHQKETGGSFRCGKNGAFVFRANNSINFPVAEMFFLIDDIGTQINGYFIRYDYLLPANSRFRCLSLCRRCLQSAPPFFLSSLIN
jgi:hypothetical protein